MNPMPVVLVTARLAETAWAERGMPQLPATGKARGVAATSAGGARAPPKPLPARGSASRQGAIPTKAIGGGGQPIARSARAASTGSTAPLADTRAAGTPTTRAHT